MIGSRNDTFLQFNNNRVTTTLDFVIILCFTGEPIVSNSVEIEQIIIF